MNRVERALQIWQVLTCAASNRQVLTYEILGDRIGMGAGTLAQSLDIIKAYCQERELPALTAIVVKKKAGKPGSGLDSVKPELLDQERERVFEYRWHRLPPVQATGLEPYA